MKKTYLTLITACALGLATTVTFAVNPVFIIQNNNPINSLENGTVGVVIPGNAFQAYGHYALINDKLNNTTTTVYKPTSSNESTTTSQQYPSVIAGQYNGNTELTFYVENAANDTYCGISYAKNPFTHQYQLLVTEMGP